jgi:hypothetical protein
MILPSSTFRVAKITVVSHHTWAQVFNEFNKKSYMGFFFFRDYDFFCNSYVYTLLQTFLLKSFITIYL